MLDSRVFLPGLADRKHEIEAFRHAEEPLTHAGFVYLCPSRVLFVLSPIPTRTTVPTVNVRQRRNPSGR
jgi:hypothetical protein